MTATGGPRCVTQIRKSMPSRSWRLSSSKLLYRSRAIGWCPDQTFVSVIPHVFVECTNDCERTTLSNAIAGSCISEPSRNVFSGVMPGQCPLWVISRHMQRTSRCPLSANSGHRAWRPSSAGRDYIWVRRKPSTFSQRTTHARRLGRLCRSKPPSGASRV